MLYKYFLAFYFNILYRVFTIYFKIYFLSQYFEPMILFIDKKLLKLSKLELKDCIYLDFDTVIL